MRDLKKYERAYTSQPFDDEHLMFRRRNIITQLNANNHAKILEISCGKRPLFMDYSNFDKLTIVEPSEMFTKNAKAELEKKSELKNKVSIINDYFEEAAEIIDSEEFDFVILSNVLQELENVEGFLKSLYKLCKDNTVVHIVVPNAKSFHRLLAFEMGLIEDVHQLSERNVLLQQNRVFDVESMTKLMVSSGFNVESSGTCFVKPFSHAQMEVVSKNEFLGPDVLNGLYRMTKYMPDLGAELYVNCKKNP